MSVYVDKMRGVPPGKIKNFPYSRACHMWADTLGELHEMAGWIGQSRSWFQARLDFPHYDLTAYKRQQAVARGAIEADRFAMRAFVEKNRATRKQEDER